VINKFENKILCWNDHLSYQFSVFTCVETEKNFIKKPIVLYDYKMYILQSQQLSNCKSNTPFITGVFGILPNSPFGYQSGNRCPRVIWVTFLSKLLTSGELRLYKIHSIKPMVHYNILINDKKLAQILYFHFPLYRWCPFSKFGNFVDRIYPNELGEKKKPQIRLGLLDTLTYTSKLPVMTD